VRWFVVRSVRMMCLVASTAVAFGQSAPLPSPADSGDAHLAEQKSDQTKTVDPGETPPDNPQPAEPSEPPENKLLTLPRQLLHDQIGMWTSPARLKLSDATWLVPTGGFAAALFATDSDFSRHLSNDPNTLLRYKHISDYGAYSMVGGAGRLVLKSATSTRRW